MKTENMPIGVVTCFGLPVYSEADMSSEIICKVRYLSEVMIDPDMSTADFYKVYTAVGVEGFCQKDFICYKSQRRVFVETSILTSIKKMLGVAEDYTEFDEDIITHINSVFLNLTQLGVGPKEGFMIEDNTAVWEDFIYDSIRLQAVKTYMYLKVKLLFDPPLSSSVTESFNRMIAELEWRLNVAVD